MAGLIGGVLALPARAQDCYIPATGDAYLWADGLGDVYGYSITYNTCQDPNVYVQVYAELDDAGWYALDSGTDIEYFGNDAEVDIAATVFYAGNYYQYGVHQYYECGYSGWEPASPEYTEYMAWSPAPNAVPTVTSTYPTDSGGDPTWTPGGGFYNGAYEVAFEGEELTGEIPTVSDSGCTSNSPGVPPYVVAAWETADNEVWTTVTVSSSLASACYLNVALLDWPVVALLAPQQVPQPTISGITPAQLLVGAATQITIAGTNLSGTTAISAQGVTFQISSATGSSVTATATVSGLDNGGTVGLTVTANGQISNSMNINKQLPTSLVRADAPGAPGGIGPLMTPVNGSVVALSGQVLATGVCGVYRNYAFDLVDQSGAVINAAYALTEHFTDYQGPYGVPSDLTSSIPANTWATDTQFIGGSPPPACLANNVNETMNQSFSVTVGLWIFDLTTLINIQRGNFNNALAVNETVTVN